MAMYEHHFLPCYTKCECGSSCDFRMSSTNNKPCWGKVQACGEQEDGDGDYRWVHACEGHRDIHDGGEYRSKDDAE